MNGLVPPRHAGKCELVVGAIKDDAVRHLVHLPIDGELHWAALDHPVHAGGLRPDFQRCAWGKLLAELVPGGFADVGHLGFAGLTN